MATGGWGGNKGPQGHWDFLLVQFKEAGMAGCAGVAGVTQLAPSFVQLSGSLGTFQTLQSFLSFWSSCFQIVVGESCSYLEGISLVSKGQSARISPLMPNEK